MLMHLLDGSPVKGRTEYSNLLLIKTHKNILALLIVDSFGQKSLA
jgi:hypothetical protein